MDRWTKDGAKGVENFVGIRAQQHRLCLPFLASAFCVKKKKTNKIREISGMYNQQTMGDIAFKFDLRGGLYNIRYVA